MSGIRRNKQEFQLPPRKNCITYIDVRNKSGGKTSSTTVNKLWCLLIITLAVIYPFPRKTFMDMSDHFVKINTDGAYQVVSYETRSLYIFVKN